MAAPAYQAKGTLSEGTGTTISFSYPTLAASDLLYLLVYNQTFSTITVGSGWALQNSIRLTNNDLGTINLYSKIASGSESGSENVTRASGSNTFAAQCYSFRGTSFISIESKSNQLARGSSDTITWQSITVGGTERVLAAFIVNVYGGDPNVPTGYTNRASESLADGTYFELHTKDNTSSDGSVTATGGSLDEWGTIHHSIYNNTPAITASRTFIVN